MNIGGKKLTRSDCMLIAMGILLLTAIIYMALTLGSSAKALSRASDKMWAYIDEKFPEINVKNHGEVPQHIGANSYILMISDADIEDIYFHVSYTNGIISDDYYKNVVKMGNTLLRLEQSMGKYIGGLMEASGSDIIRTEVKFPPRVKNDIPDSIYPDVKFDPTHPIYRGSILTIICTATDDMGEIAEIFRKAHSVAAENQIMFSSYELYGVECDSVYSLEINGVDSDMAGSAMLDKALRAAAYGENQSPTDIGNITVRLVLKPLVSED